MQDYIPRKIDINEQLPTVIVKQFDNLSRFIHVQIFDNDLPDISDDEKYFNLENCTARLYVQPKGDDSGTNVAYIDGEVADDEQGIVTFLLPSSVTETAGNYEGEIWIYGAESSHPIISTKSFDFVVEKSIRNNTAIAGTSKFTALDNVLSDNDLMRAQMEALIASPAGSGGDVGTELRDIRTGYDNIEYETAGEAVRNQVSNLDNVLRGGREIDLLSNATLFGNYYVNANGVLTTSASWRSYYIDNKFSKIEAVLYGQSDSFKAISFYTDITDIPSDASYISGLRFDSGTIEYQDSNTTGRRFSKITIPSGTKYILFSHRIVGEKKATITGVANVEVLEALVNTLKSDVDTLQSDTESLEENVEIINNEISELKRIDTIENAASEISGYYNESLGKFSGNINWMSYIFNSSGFKKIISASAYTNNAGIYNLFFFSDDSEFNATTLISHVSLSVGTNVVNNYANIDIPDNCKSVILCNNTANYSTPNISIEIELLKEIESTSNDADIKANQNAQSITDIFNDIDDLKPSNSSVKSVYHNIWNANDFVIIGDEFWFSKPIYRTDDQSQYEIEDGNERIEIRRYKLIDNQFVLQSTIKANFGHFNTVDYCPENDCLIFGNGSNNTLTEGNWFAVVPHPLELTGDHIKLSEVGIKYPVDSTYGYKIQAVWGDDNRGKYDVAYVFSRDSTIFVKAILEKDDNGDFAYTQQNNEQVGQFFVLERFEKTQITDRIGVGGADFWGGTLYIGQGNYNLHRISMSDYTDNPILKKLYSNYHNNGNWVHEEYSGSMQGVFINERYIWVFFNIQEENQSGNYLIQYYR